MQSPDISEKLVSMAEEIPRHQHKDGNVKISEKLVSMADQKVR